MSVSTKFVCLIFFIMFSISFIASAQQKKESIQPLNNQTELALKKLLDIAINPKDNGLGLIDTIWPIRYLGNPNSTIKIPEASATTILSRSVSNINSTSHIDYTWISRLKNIPRADTLALHKCIGQLQQTIARVLPKVRDTFYTTNYYHQNAVWEWKPKSGVSLQLVTSTSKNVKDPVEIQLFLTVKKSVKQVQKKITDSLINLYVKNSLYLNRPKEAASYFLTLMKMLRYEGITEQETLNIIKPKFKLLANKDIIAAFEVLMNCDNYAQRPLQFELTPEQNAKVRTLSQKLIDEFDAKYYGKKTTQQSQIAVVPSKPQKQIFNTYYTNAQNPVASSRFIYIDFKDVNGLYKFHEIEFIGKRGKDKWRLIRKGIDKMESDFYFSATGEKWIPVSITDCAICYGTGTRVSRTPYTYYYEQKGIYNKYTYSGSGYNTTSETCSSCKGEGYWITRL